jgi:hypothetical protein
LDLFDLGMVCVVWFGVCMDVGLVVRFAPLAGDGPTKKIRMEL